MKKINTMNLIILISLATILSVNVIAQGGCDETDGGVDVFTKGSMKTTHTWIDECSGDFLKEYNCMVSPYYLIYECYNGCENGACNSGEVSKQWITCKELCPSGFEKDSEGFILCKCKQGDIESYNDDLAPIGKDYDKLKEYLDTLSISKIAELTHLGLIRPELALRYNSGGKLDEKYKSETEDSVIDLSNHPYFFFFNGLPNLIIVIGDNAQKDDIDAANRLLTWFNDRASNQMYPKTKIYKASEISSTARNIISVGEPCTNSISQKISHKTKCGFGLNKGEYAVYLWNHDDFINLAIGGYSSDLTNAAIEKLIEYSQFNKFELNGREMIFGQCIGCVNDNYECIEIGSRTENSFCGLTEEFDYFKQNEQNCDYNYECETNNCRKNKCKPECDGCLDENDKCIPIGTRSSDQYCNSFGDFTNLKENRITCEFDYECKVNNCNEKICIPQCNGCLDNNDKCLPIGTKSSSNFCDVTGKFVNIKEPLNECNFDYECSSDKCNENLCYEPKMLKRFFNWIGSIF
jgi:hypothetical protein